ncbi:MAG: 2-C-methyl-D-erythritol 2,4-cyclodiphosphate synthase [Desulfobacteraceae bacterium]
MRIGQGYDVHRLEKGRKLFLGGVHIPFEKGLLGHSDADVLVHAACDAILGAAGLGDLGEHFPDTDPRFKEIRSLKLLSHCAKLIEANGYQVANLDASIIAQEPKLAPYRGQMQENMARVLNISTECINIKATTTEGLGFTGQGQGMAAMCVVLLESPK